MDLNIQESQKAAVGNMLNLSQQLGSGSGVGGGMNGNGGAGVGGNVGYGNNKNNVWILEGPHIWKVLIYDRTGQTILSPLMKVGSLRHHGVTLHIQINTQKSPIPEVPGLYFIKPTEENIDKLCDDLKNLFYESYYINFLSPCSDKLLEYFAKKALETGNANRITKVIDRYLDFVSLSPYQFSLGMDKVYSEFYNSKTGDDKIQQIMDNIVIGLICVFSSLGVIPIIRCSSNQYSPSQMIARELDKRLRDLLKKTSNSNAFDMNSNNRPVLILLDRNIDLSSMINHTWIYQGLIHDIYNLKLNRITVDDQNNSKKVFDLDSNDEFWIKHSGEHFTQVANSVSELLSEYNKKLSELNYSNEDSTQMANNLVVAINSIPEMTEKKRSIDTHTNIATRLVDEIKKRELDKLFEIEESFDNIPTVSGCINEIDNLFNSNTDKTFLTLDKLRVVLSLLTHERHSNNISNQNIDSLVKYFDGNVDYVNIIKYIYVSNIQSKNSAVNVSAFSGNISNNSSTLESINNTNNILSSNNNISANNGASHGFGPGLNSNYNNSQDPNSFQEASKSGITSIAKNVGGKVFDMAGKNILQGVRALLPINKTLKITSIVENIMEKKPYFSASNIANSTQLSSNSNYDDYLYFDPKQPCLHDQDTSKVPRIKVNPRQGIVFLIGGGNFVEAHDVLNYAKRTQKNIIYGCTEFVNPSEFIKELEIISS
ncbi:hypothetical protein FG379_002669 [Cryptosporidium bovis]|uniref:uncharacterized protein n=1 Tax=Cryptosporidium bovis TaxID=310047 RepID=UPI00351A8847|nr:hypothetical protein FG379_002669 [Cryptosporidium bovis]